MFKFAYLMGALFWCSVWGILYIVLKKHRQAMLWTSVVIAPVGPIGEFWFLNDYWQPEFLLDISIGSWRFGIEDLLIAFSLSGICAGVYEQFVNRSEQPEIPRFNRETFFRMLSWGALGFSLVVVFGSVVRLGSFNSLFFSAMIVSFMIFFKRKIRLPTVLLLALLFGFVYFLFYKFFFMPLFPGVMREFWFFDKLWGIFVAGIPIEELIWAAMTMVLAGPFYRACSSAPEAEA